jgi:hypothetical protein
MRKCKLIQQRDDFDIISSLPHLAWEKGLEVVVTLIWIIIREYETLKPNIILKNAYILYISFNEMKIVDRRKNRPKNVSYRGIKFHTYDALWTPLKMFYQLIYRTCQSLFPFAMVLSTSFRLKRSSVTNV